MKARLYLKGLENYLEDLATQGKNVGASADKALIAGADVAVTGMKRRAPKDTHNLEEHITHTPPEVDGNQHSIEVGLIHSKAYTDAETARYGNAQEYGSSSIPAHPFKRPTMDEDKAKIMTAMRKSLKEDGKL